MLELGQNMNVRGHESYILGFSSIYPFLFAVLFGRLGICNEGISLKFFFIGECAWLNCCAILVTVKLYFDLA